MIEKPLSRGNAQIHTADGMAVADSRHVALTQRSASATARAITTASALTAATAKTLASHAAPRACFWGVFLLLFLVQNAFALSVKDDAWCRKVSPEYAQTEDDLNILWKKLNTLIPNKDVKHKLLQNQRAWLKERDDRYDEGNGKIDVTNLTYHTRERIAALVLYEQYVRNNFLPITVTGRIIGQSECRSCDEIGYFLLSQVHVGKHVYDVYISLVSSEDREKHKDVDVILTRALESKDTCHILIDYDILGKIQPLFFVNPSKNEKCHLPR